MARIRYAVLTALVVNLTFTTYANDSHYVLLLPVWLWLIARRRTWLAAWGLAWLVFLRLVGFPGEVLFALALLAGMAHESGVAFATAGDRASAL